MPKKAHAIASDPNPHTTPMEAMFADCCTYSVASGPTVLVDHSLSDKDVFALEYVHSLASGPTLLVDPSDNTNMFLLKKLTEATSIVAEEAYWFVTSSHEDEDYTTGVIDVSYVGPMLLIIQPLPSYLLPLHPTISLFHILFLLKPPWISALVVLLVMFPVPMQILVEFLAFLWFSKFN
mmetsp:Transcript_50882/g.61317  ORF Transcript_50882/g.61317 Transcript_50882/m.61317 type:complete len:179 (+) Transcript_50882:199-735(+)